MTETSSPMLIGCRIWANVAKGQLFRMLATGVLASVTMTLAAVVLCLGLWPGQFML